MNKIVLLSLIGIAAVATSACTSVPREPAADSHAHEMAAMGAMTDACSKVGWSDTISPAQAEVIRKTMSSREHRLHHALWHAVRGGLEVGEAHDVVNAFGSSWTQFHPICPAPTADVSGAKANPAGEDFLYMHRELIGMLRRDLTAAGVPCIKGWDHVPTPKEWSLPDKTRTDAKSDSTLAQLQSWDKYFHDANWLRSHSLSEVGWSLELTVHNNLHMRYATDKPPKGFEGDGAPVPFDGKFPADWKWDSPAYNWLADPYGAHVNPVFWKIHGYVDGVIDAWLAANSYDEIAVNCSGRTRCYQWRGMWTGELTLPKGDTPRGPPTAQNPAARAKQIKEFNKRRMALQRLGVLKSSGTKSPPRAPAPGSDDPYEMTKASRCPAH